MTKNKSEKELAKIKAHEEAKRKNKRLMIIVAVAIFFIYLVYTNIEGFMLKMQGEDPAEFEISGTTAHINGVIYKNTAKDFENIVINFPELKTLSFDFVPKSLNQDAVFKMSEIIEKNKINTVVPSDGLVASGVLDIFIAGVNRTIESGAKVGVNAKDSIEGLLKDLSKDHEIHQKFLEYYKKMGIPDDFYWFSVNAPTNDIKWLTNEEIEAFKLIK